MDTALMVAMAIVLVLVLFTPGRGYVQSIKRDKEVSVMVLEIVDPIVEMWADYERAFPQLSEHSELNIANLRASVAPLRESVVVADKYLNKKWISFNSYANYCIELKKVVKR